MWFDIKKDLLFTRFILMIIKLEISRISSFVGLYLRSGNLSRLYNGEVIWGQSSRIVGECFVGPLRPFGIKKYKFVWNYNWGGYPFQMLPSCITPMLPSYWYSIFGFNIWIVTFLRLFFDKSRNIFLLIKVKKIYETVIR